MNNSRDDFISTLTSGLEPVRPVTNVDRMAALWLFGSALYVIGITHWLGPIRSNAFAQLASEPRFLVETLSGVLAIVVVGLASFRAAIPGALSVRFATAGAILMGLWVGSYVFGLVSPALEPSMLGKRHYCVWETFVYGLPPMLLGFVLVRRLYPIQPVKIAMSFSLTAGMIPALYMQIACMYVPAHILKFHILPAILVAVVGAAIAWISRPRQTTD
jgi:hypothetical protein